MLLMNSFQTKILENHPNITQITLVPKRLIDTTLIKI
jgi:hypothetical protein